MATIATMTATKDDDQKIRCPSCKMPASTKQLIEKLPGNGQLWRVEHADGKVCQLARYKSPYDVHLTKKEADYVFERIRPKNEESSSQELDTNNWKRLVLSKLDSSFDLLHSAIKMLIDGPPASMTGGISAEKLVKKRGKNRSDSSKEIIRQRKEPIPPIPTNYRQVKPVNKTLTTCVVCGKPGYIYHMLATHTKKRTVYFIHYNEPPIGWTTRHGKPIRLKFRTCHHNREVTA